MSPKMSRAAVRASCSCGLIAALLFGVSWPLAATSNPIDRAWQNSSARQPPDAPVAIVKSIIVEGIIRTEAAEREFHVKRTDNTVAPGKAGMFLYHGDQVFTGDKTQSTLLFLEDAAEKNNEVVVDANAKIQIGSVYDWFGRIILRVRGTFETKTEKVKLGVKGTEFELVAGDSEDRIIVLEGVVTAERGSFGPTIGSSASDAWPGARDLNSSVFLKSSFTQGMPPQAADFEVSAGQASIATWSHIFNSGCKKSVTFEVHPPQDQQWFRLLEGNKIKVKPGTQQTNLSVKIDATRLPVGIRDLTIAGHCLDCAEKRCRFDDISQKIRVKISALPVPIALGAETLLAGKKEEMTADAKRLEKRAAPDDLIAKAIAWSSEVIIQSHPSYAAQSITPNFPDAAARARAFRQARLKAALTSDPLSYQELGDVLLDMGDGAKALDAYQRIGNLPEYATADYFTNLGEAYRLAGHLDEAEAVLVKALALDSSWALALNALGNIYLDQANAKRDEHKYDAAIGLLEKAKDTYTRAFEEQAQTTRSHYQADQAQPPAATSGRRIDRGIVQSNLGEVYRAFGDIAQARKRNSEALLHYQRAEQLFKQAQGLSLRYPFAHAGLGGVYREMSKVASLPIEQIRTAKLSKAEYRSAIEQHSDLAAAYLGLGNLSADVGSTALAIESFEKATTLRPEDAGLHLSLAIALATRNPQLAAAHSQTYLSLERRPFEQGDKAQVAMSLSKGGERLPVPRNQPELRRSPQRPEHDEARNPPYPPQVVVKDRLEKVPNVTKKDLKTAIRILSEHHLMYDILNEHGDYVVKQSPAPGTFVVPRSPVHLTLRSRSDK